MSDNVRCGTWMPHCVRTSQVRQVRYGGSVVTRKAGRLLGIKLATHWDSLLLFLPYLVGTCAQDNAR